MRIGIKTGEGHGLGRPGFPVPSMIYPLHNLRWRKIEERGEVIEIEATAVGGGDERQKEGGLN